MTARPLLTIAAATLALSCSLSAAEESSVSLEGLQLVEKDNRGAIYADPEADWSRYTQVQLLDATVAFRRNWQRDQNRGDPFKVDAKDMERIKSELAALFREVFTEELTANGGYTMATAAGDHVLTIKPAIVDLDAYAPDTMQAGRSRQYTESAGKMTLKLELYDSVSGALLATASDRREAPRRGYMQWTSSVENRAEAERMLRQWAEGLRERLDKARGPRQTTSTN